MKHYGDITKLDGYTLPPVDIVTGGSPCQDLSVAGKREGLAGERSGLFMEQIRVIKEMRENDRRNGRTGDLVRPRYMVWENVPGAFSSNRGEDFRAVLEETARVADEDAVIPGLAEKQKWSSSGAILGDGWSIAWRVHDAQFWGVPQRRKRISLVADFGGPTAPEILFERESLSGDLEPCAEEREETAGAVKGSPGTASYTLKIRGGADTYIKPNGSVGTAGKGPLVQKELSGTLGVSQDQTLITTAEGGETYAVDMGAGKSTCGIHENLSPTLATTHYGEPVVLQSNQNNATVDQNGVCFTLPASAGMGGGYVPMIAYRKTGHPRSSEEGQGWEKASVNDTLNSFDNTESRSPTCVVYGLEPGAMQRLNVESRYSEERSPTLRSNMGDNQAAVAYSIDKAVTTGANCTAGGDCVHCEYTSPLTTDRPHAVAYGVVSKGNGDAFISEERHTSLSTGGGEPGQGYPCVVYGISPYASNAMLSDNPNSGVYETDTARTLDLNGGSPACNQGGMAIVQGADVYNGTLTGEIAATITEAVGMPNTSGAKVLSYGLDGYNQDIEEETAQPLRSADGGDTTPKVVCLEGNGSRPSHRGDGYSESETMYTLNGTEHHAVYDARGNGDGDVVPTIIGDHENRITDYTAVVYDASRRHNYEPFGEVSETVQASYGTGGNNQPIVVENPSYQRTPGSLMASGYSKLGTQEAANDMYVVQSQSWDGTQIAPTLTSNNAGGNQRMPDKDNFNAVVQSLETYHCTAEVDKVQTLKARDYKDPQVVTYGIDQQGGKGGASYTVDVSPTMASDSHGTPHGVCAAIDCRNGTEDTDVNASLQSASAHNINSNNVCRQNSVVRRLTPLECERLQGFPDGWTDIDDWVDSKGKLHKGEADSPRYKALGNSIALPFWQWMAERMVKNLGEQPTMASLFDGIGGFPLVFSRCGCTPVWASEIEEFPIAVTKIHFPEKE